jgi:hypothetical protein
MALFQQAVWSTGAPWFECILDLLGEVRVVALMHLVGVP